MQEMWAWPLSREDPLEEEMATHSSVLAWEFQGQRSLAGYSPWGCKQLDMTERLSNNNFLDINTLVVGFTLSKTSLLNSWKYKLVLISSRISLWDSLSQLCATVWTIALQAPLSMRFSRQEHWSGWSCPHQGISLTQESNPSLFCLLHWQVGSLSPVPPGEAQNNFVLYYSAICCLHLVVLMYIFPYQHIHTFISFSLIAAETPTTRIYKTCSIILLLMGI